MGSCHHCTLGRAQPGSSPCVPSTPGNTAHMVPAPQRSWEPGLAWEAGVALPAWRSPFAPWSTGQDGVSVVGWWQRDQPRSGLCLVGSSMLGHSSEGTWVMIRVRHLDRRQSCAGRRGVCVTERGGIICFFFKFCCNQAQRPGVGEPFQIVCHAIGICLNLRGGRL